MRRNIQRQRPMTLKKQITEDMKSAMKSGERDRLKVLRLTLAAIKQIEVDERIELDDRGVLKVLDKMVKQRRDSVSQFVAGGRKDLADIETTEISVLETYLPEQLSESELESLVDEVISSTGAEHIRDMGRVMGVLTSKAQGRADMSLIAALVKTRLGG